MKPLLNLISFLFIMFISITAFADTTIPGGSVSGTWTASGSPFLVMGDITVPTDSTLTIEPGVEVEFQGFYSFTVNGYLQAVGTETDSIHFFPVGTIYGWNTLRFENAPDSSHLAYCTISHSGHIGWGMGGIICTNSNPVITHCRISDNKARGGFNNIAGGIALNNSNAEISWCDIRNNYSPDYGGGIYITNSSPVITGCNISGNETIMRGGGIYVAGSSSPIITGCTIENNTSNMHGGGISVVGGVITISECTIGYNRAYDEGGGIAIFGGVTTISGCTIGYNEADDGGGGIAIFGGSVSLDHCTCEHNRCWVGGAGRGGGVFINGGTLTMDHCTLFADYVSYNQYGMEIYTGGSAAMTIANSIISFSDYYLVCFESSTPPSVSNNNFYIPPYNSQLYFTGNVPSGLGVLTQVNYNGDSCDVYSNIFLDPLFEDIFNDNLQITWSNWPAADSTKSPCIDAGDPAGLKDPDSTTADIGAYYFNYTRPLISVSDTLLDFGIVDVGQALNLAFIIRNNGTTDLNIQNISNSQDGFSHNWSSGDNLVPPGDSLEVMVSFTPVDSLNYIDTLFIENNDNQLKVILTGSGIIPPHPVITLSDTLFNFGTLHIGHNADTTFTIYNSGLETLAIYNMTNIQSVFTTDYNPADSLILPGDSLSVMVTFTPTEIGSVIDTLSLNTNDQYRFIILTGVAQSPTGISDLTDLIPKKYALYPAYPNPFNPSTTIKFDLPKQSFVTLKVYTILGEEVSTLISKQIIPGRHKYIWNANNLASGVYFYRLHADEFIKVRKIVLLR